MFNYRDLAYWRLNKMWYYQIERKNMCTSSLIRKDGRAHSFHIDVERFKSHHVYLQACVRSFLRVCMSDGGWVDNHYIIKIMFSLEKFLRGHLKCVSEFCLNKLSELLVDLFFFTRTLCMLYSCFKYIKYPIQQNWLKPNEAQFQFNSNKPKSQKTQGYVWHSVGLYCIVKEIQKEIQQR